MSVPLALRHSGRCAATRSGARRDDRPHRRLNWTSIGTEDVVSLRTQTHSDFDHADMQIYPRRLGALADRPPAN
jgi:hypothetical protein